MARLLPLIVFALSASSALEAARLDHARSTLADRLYQRAQAGAELQPREPTGLDGSEEQGLLGVPLENPELVRPGQTGAWEEEHGSPTTNQSSAFGGGLSPHADDTPQDEVVVEENLARALKQADPARIAAAFAQGLEAVTLGIYPFMQKPPDYENGIRILNDQFWKVVLILVPEEYHESWGVLKAKKAWNRAFTRTPEITRDLQEFTESGNTEPLTRAIKSLLYLAVKMATDVFPVSKVCPKLAEYFDAIVDLVDGIASSWDMHAEGRTTQAIEGMWKAVKLAVDDVAPDAIKTDATYSLVVGAIDGVMSRLTEYVLDYKRHMLQSKVCYKRSIPRQRRRPQICRPGFEWDQGHLCLPTVSSGADCLQPCGGGGMCPSFCGEKKACCRRGDRHGPIECKDATGFVDFAFTTGTSKDYHQCVRPGPAVAYTVKNCGDLRLNGLWVRNEQNAGKPRYTHIDDKNAILEWSHSRQAWRLYVDDTWIGHGRDTLYGTAQKTPTVPLSGWVTLNGVEPAPTIEVFTPPKPAASLVQIPGLDAALWNKPQRTYGTHEAECDVSSEEVEKAGKWCVSRCPDGYRAKNGQTCVQECGGRFPVDMAGLCAKETSDIYNTLVQMATMVGNTAVKSWLLMDEMRKSGVDAERLTKTITTFIEMGKPFARPMCPEEGEEDSEAGDMQ